MLEISTPALLFPAVSLLFLAYTTRFLALAALIRRLHEDWLARKAAHLLRQIENLKIRLKLIRWMQMLGACSLCACLASMGAVLAQNPVVALSAFKVALGLMGFSLVALLGEIALSGGALRVLLEEVREEETPDR
jgi:hypothetical protein